MRSEDIECAYLAWLAHCAIPADRKSVLIQTFLSGEAVYESFRRKDPTITEILSPGQIRSMERKAGKEELNQWYMTISKHGIRAITSCHPMFPVFLTQISDPASILFYQGQFEIVNNRSVAMVGSRNSSAQGLQAARSVSLKLSQLGITVVSGFAYGIDSACHEGCLEGKAPTVAVMGCGLDQHYPSGNEPMRRRILDCGGLLLSEYAPGEQPFPYHFPYRNRIISGISQAVVLIEARIRSGSLTTINHALNQGKEIFVYPGVPGSPYYEGNHILLREGARYFTSALDIAEDMNWLDNPADVAQNIDCSKTFEPHSENEKTILDMLHSGPMSFEQMIAISNISAADLMQVLTMLQIRGIVESLPGKNYQINHTKR